MRTETQPTEQDFLPEDVVRQLNDDEIRNELRRISAGMAKYAPDLLTHARERGDLDRRQIYLDAVKAIRQGREETKRREETVAELARVQEEMATRADAEKKASTASWLKTAEEADADILKGYREQLETVRQNYVGSRARVNEYIKGVEDIVRQEIPGFALIGTQAIANSYEKDVTTVLNDYQKQLDELDQKWDKLLKDWQSVIEQYKDALDNRRRLGIRNIEDQIDLKIQKEYKDKLVQLGQANDARIQQLDEATRKPWDVGVEELKSSLAEIASTANVSFITVLLKIAQELDGKINELRTHYKTTAEKAQRERTAEQLARRLPDPRLATPQPIAVQQPLPVAQAPIAPVFKPLPVLPAFQPLPTVQPEIPARVPARVPIFDPKAPRFEPTVDPFVPRRKPAAPEATPPFPEWTTPPAVVAPSPTAPFTIQPKLAVPASLSIPFTVPQATTYFGSVRSLCDFCIE